MIENTHNNIFDGGDMSEDPANSEPENMGDEPVKVSKRIVFKSPDETDDDESDSFEMFAQKIFTHYEMVKNKVVDIGDDPEENREPTEEEKEQEEKAFSPEDENLQKFFEQFGGGSSSGNTDKPDVGPVPEEIDADPNGAEEDDDEGSMSFASFSKMFSKTPDDDELPNIPDPDELVDTPVVRNDDPFDHELPLGGSPEEPERKSPFSFIKDDEPDENDDPDEEYPDEDFFPDSESMQNALRKTEATSDKSGYRGRCIKAREDRDIRDAFYAKSLSMEIDNIMYDIDTFLNNDKDVTDEILKEKKEETERLDSKSDEEQNLLDGLAPVSETNEPEEYKEYAPLSTKDRNEAIKDINTESGKQTVFEKQTHDHIREYDWKHKKPVIEKPRYGKGVITDEGYAKDIGFFIIAGLSFGTYLGLKVSSYCIRNHYRVKNPIGCIMGAFSTNNPISLDPIDLSVFLKYFLIGAAIIAMIGLARITDKKAKKDRREGHEHGKSRFGTKKDYKKFQKDFMDMS